MTLGSVGFSLWISIKFLHLLNTDTFIFVLLFFIFLGSLLYIQVNTFFVVLQYYRCDKNKRLVITADGLTLELYQESRNITVNTQDVVNVEIYEGKPWGRFRDFDYLVIYLTNNERIVITEFTIPDLIRDETLENFLHEKPIAYFRKRFNYIEK